jgi:hypothetical protein
MNKAWRFSVVGSAIRTLCIEHSITADMSDGLPSSFESVTPSRTRVVPTQHALFLSVTAFPSVTLRKQRKVAWLWAL